MKSLKLLFLLVLVVAFTGCGSSDSKDTSDESLVLTDKLKANSFYAVKDNIYTDGAYKIDFDQNLTSWNITPYDLNFSKEGNTTTADINVTNLKISDGSGELVYSDHNEKYINFVAKISSLTKLKLFETKEDALEYLNKSLFDELKGKEFYAVSNNTQNKQLYKFTFDSNATHWDVLTYDKSYSEDNITGTFANANIAVKNNTLQDGSVLYALNSIESSYISLVNTENSNVSFRLYTDQSKALEYYNAYNLRDDLAGQTIYAVSHNGENSGLFKFVFSQDLTTWNISTYETDFKEATQSADANIVVQEDRITDSGDTLLLKEKTQDYIELQGVKNKNLIFRFYTTQEAALNGADTRI